MSVEVALGVVLLVTGGAWRAFGSSPLVPVELWQLVTYTGVAVLAIGLVRDLAIFARRVGDRPAPSKRAGEKLLCLESTVGGLLVIAGLGLVGLEVRHELAMHAATLAAAGGVVLIASGLGKDVVVVFRREKDHQNLIPW